MLDESFVLPSLPPTLKPIAMPATAAAPSSARSPPLHCTGGTVARARLTPVTERVENQLKRLPAKPGVYIFRDERGDVLYVGKAKSLRPRVRSYFQASADVR